MKANTVPNELDIKIGGEGEPLCTYKSLDANDETIVMEIQERLVKLENKLNILCSAFCIDICIDF